MNTSCCFASLIPFGYKNQTAFLLKGKEHLAKREKSNREVLALLGEPDTFFQA